MSFTDVIEVGVLDGKQAVEQILYVSHWGSQIKPIVR